jgi:hypothetical protein
MAPQLEGGCDTSGLSIFDRTVDHVLPEVFGGGSEPDNLVKACWPCNHCKFDFTQPLVDPADAPGADSPTDAGRYGARRQARRVPGSVEFYSSARRV